MAMGASRLTLTTRGCECCRHLRPITYIPDAFENGHDFLPNNSILGISALRYMLIYYRALFLQNKKCNYMTRVGATTPMTPGLHIAHQPRCVAVGAWVTQHFGHLLLLIRGGIAPCSQDTGLVPSSSARALSPTNHARLLPCPV